MQRPIRSGPMVVAVLLLGVSLAGCGGSDGSDGGGGGSTTPVVIDITENNGAITPDDGHVVDVDKGQQVQLVVSTDKADEIHVHSVPDHEFEVEAKPGQTFDFTVDVPGSVEVELHHLNRTVATIQVRP